MKQFLHKFVFISIQKEKKIMRHKCAKVTDISDTHISLLDTFDNEPYFYRIIDIIEIKLSKKNPNKFERSENE